jgi:hypothetical protein
MKKMDLSPLAHLQGRDAANRYDEDLLDKLAREREHILEQKTTLGRAGTKLAAFFYRGDLALNQWQTDRVRRTYDARNMLD